MVRMEEEKTGLVVKDLSVYYGTHQVLDSINLSVKPGEVMAVIGPNGSGKSTLIRTASGILTPKNGRVFVNGVDIHGISPEKRARLISVVPQAIRLPDAFSTYETIMMGRTPYVGWFGRENEGDEIVVVGAMERTDTLEFAERLIGELSGGEQQRVLIARALAQSTQVMLMDEPTAHLDLKHQSNIMGLIQRLARKDNLAILIILHDLNLAALYADRVALLVEGKIFALGTPVEVLNPDFLSSAYGVPVNVITHPIYHSPLILPDGK